MMRSGSVFALSCAVFLACSSDDDTATIASPAAFVTAAHEAACSALFRCPPPTADLAMQQALLASVARCTQLRTGAALLGWGDLDDLVASTTMGKTRYDGAAAVRCIARIASTCDVQHPIAALCADVFVGTVATGAACLRSEECADNGWCQREPAMGVRPCPGVCRARVRVGGACTVNEECAPQAVGQRAECFPDATGMSRCIPVRTGERAAEGRPCGHQVTASAGYDTQCENGLVCASVTGSLAGTCQRAPMPGAPCGEGVRCGVGAMCSGTGATARCLTLQVRRAAGEACNSAMGMLCDPYARLTCRANVCSTFGDGSVGTPCMTMQLPPMLQCGAGNWCNGGRCAERKALGMRCMSDFECQSNACDTSMNVCVARSCR